MDESELEKLSPSEGAPVLAADKKRRNLEENMRREAEERRKKKQELLRMEREYEKVQKPLAIEHFGISKCVPLQAVYLLSICRLVY